VCVGLGLRKRTCPLAAQLTILLIGSCSRGTPEGPPGETVYLGKPPRFEPLDLRISYWGFSAMPVPNPVLKVDPDNQKV
jgi:hypothetical protein